MPRPVGRAVSGARIRELRLAAGLPRQALGIHTHRSEVTVGRWERDEARPPSTCIGAIAEALGVTVADLYADAPGGAA